MLTSTQHSDSKETVNQTNLNSNGELTSHDLLNCAPVKDLNPQRVTKLPSQLKQESSIYDASESERFSHLISIMPAGVLVIDHKGIVSLANYQAKNLLREPLEGHLWRDVIARVFAPKADDGHEVSTHCGKRLKIDISPLQQEKGQLIVINDLTETRELQSRMGHMQRLSSLGKMVASVAHQVRTPLSSALLYAENLKCMPLQNAMATKFSNKLTIRLKELESQVNDMLLFAKSSHNQIVSELSPKQVQVQAIAQMEAQLKDAKVTLCIQNDEFNQQAMTPKILGNLGALAGAITNLIGNAMQVLQEDEGFTKPVIKLGLNNKSVNNVQYCVFSVRDNGKGLNESTISRLFEPFFTTKSQGTGLGLAVVNTVAKSHKGFVKCGNNPDKGAYFSIYIPLINEQKSSVNSQQLSSHYSQKLAGAEHE